MTFRKIVIILIMLSLFVLPASYAAFNPGFQAPNEFEQVSTDNSTMFDIYFSKSNKNLLLFIMDYSDEDYELFFETDIYNHFYVTDLGNNMVMGKDNTFNEGFVSEVVAFNGNKYIVQTSLNETPTDSQIKDTVKYLDEFNKLNNVTPIPAQDLNAWDVSY